MRWCSSQSPAFLKRSFWIHLCIGIWIHWEIKTTWPRCPARVLMEQDPLQSKVWVQILSPLTPCSMMLHNRPLRCLDWVAFYQSPSQFPVWSSQCASHSEVHTPLHCSIIQKQHRPGGRSCQRIMEVANLCTHLSPITKYKYKNTNIQKYKSPASR